MSSTLVWIVSSSLLMSLLALTGGLALWVKEKWFQQLLSPLVAMAAGSMLGGALFHLIPASIERLGNQPGPFVAVAAGFSSFLALEQFLHWHHCRQGTTPTQKPVGHLVLWADTLHKFIDGVAVAGAFVIDTRLGVTTWLLTAAHELPQELGDFGILLKAGFGIRQALTYNFLSGLAFLAGGLLTYRLSATLEIAWLLPFAAGNFLYVSCADLIPEVSKERRNLLHLGAFLFGLVLVLLLR